MSHACIISRDKHPLAAASYTHLKARKCYETVTLLHSTDQVSQFLPSTDIRLVIVEDNDYSTVYQTVKGKITLNHISIIVIGVAPTETIHPHIYSVGKETQPDALLELIDLIIWKQHSQNTFKNFELKSKTLRKLYSSIRFVEYSSKSITYHLRNSSHCIPFHAQHFIPLSDQRFVHVNNQCIINAEAIARFTHNEIVMNKNERIPIARENMEDCWEALCAYFMNRKSCSPFCRRRRLN